MRPLLLVGVYLHANNVIARDELITRLATCVASTWEEFCLVGDWNCEALEGGVAQMLAAGRVYCADDTFEHTACGTVPSGRRIDYALTSRSVVFNTMTQEPGTADHDCVSYHCFECEETIPIYGRPIRTVLKRRTPITDDELRSCLSVEHFVANLHEPSPDVDSAWRCLSDAAEQLLMQDPDSEISTVRKPRSQPWQPTRRTPGDLGGQRRNAEPLRVRRVKRLLRRWGTAVRTVRADSVYMDKLWQSVQRMRKYYVVLDDVQRDSVMSTLEHILQGEAQRMSTQRLQMWLGDTGANYARLRRWVRAGNQEDSMEGAKRTKCVQRAIHPAHQVDEQNRKWIGVWNRPHPEDHVCGTNLDPQQHTDATLQNILREHVGALNLCFTSTEGYACDNELLPCDAVMQAARSGRGRAAGPDDWTCDDLLRLPQPWWHCFHQLWRAVLRAGRVPDIWRSVKVAFRPKPDGELRPLSLAAVAWRIGASAIVQQLGQWSNKWAPEHLIGGLAGRSADDFHGPLHRDMAQSWSEGVSIASQDLPQDFDSLHGVQTMAVLHRFNAPSALLRILLHFYSGIQRIFQVRAPCRHSGNIPHTA